MMRMISGGNRAQWPRTMKQEPRTAPDVGAAALRPTKCVARSPLCIYFVFAVIGGGIGPTFIALFTDFVIGDERLLRYALSLSAPIMMPPAAWIIWSGVRPYGEAIREVRIREQQEAARD